ncbi:MAG: NAD(P)H-dependent oxidoreductase [Firmicutes bacterium]|nr:NAD(P)H-dependent oxidoreductase [Bacillota bacterium]
MSNRVHIVAMSGSLRKQSYNTALLKEAKRLLADVADVDILEIGHLPFYNQDLDAAVPASVAELAERIRLADGVLLATPEYNFSYSAVLKSALEWLSRQCTGAPLAGKPVGVLGATLGAFGTTRGQRHLRDVLFSLDAVAVNRPEVCIAFANQKFDDQGILKDEATLTFLKQHLDNLIALARK